MSESTVHFHLLQYFIAQLNLHKATNGHNEDHPMINISNVDYLLKTKAPIKFITKTYKNFKPNISKFNAEATVFETPTSEESPTNLNSTVHTPTSAYILQNGDSTEEIIEYNATINAFCHRPYGSTMICDACGMRGYKAAKCFRREIAFLPQDLQRRIMAYNSKYDNNPSTEKSTNKDKTILPAPTATIDPTPSNMAKTSDIMDTHPSTAVINKLEHSMMASTIKDDVELSRQANLEFIQPTGFDTYSPHLKSLSHTLNTSKQVSSIHKVQPSIHSVAINTLTTLPTDLIDPQGKVNVVALSTLQITLINPASQKCFTPTRYQYFHIGGGANVHATNKKDDFMLYYPYRSTLDLEVGNKTSTMGFGVMLVRFSPNLPPVPLAPVFYCQDAPNATLSPPALRLFNKYTSVLLDSLTSLSITFLTNKQLL